MSAGTSDKELMARGQALWRSREGWSGWVGPEVEGRLLGATTLCIVEPSALAFAHSVPHILFTTPYLESHGFAQVERYIDSHLVTLEVSVGMLSEIPAALAERCHLLVRVQVGAIHDLGVKPTDTIRLDFGPFHVATVTFEQFHETRPGEYLVDERVFEPRANLDSTTRTDEV